MELCAGDKDTQVQKQTTTIYWAVGFFILLSVASFVFGARPNVTSAFKMLLLERDLNTSHWFLRKYAGKAAVCSLYIHLYLY